jgi:hypothetical protein
LRFEHTVSALVYSIVRERCVVSGEEWHLNRVVRFVLCQHDHMPDYLRLPIKLLTLVFSMESLLTSGCWFQRLQHKRRWAQVLRWRRSRLGLCRDLIKFYESLAVFGWHADCASGGESPGREEPRMAALPHAGVAGSPRDASLGSPMGWGRQGLAGTRSS